MRKHFHIRVRGFVQGVFFRYTAKEEAEKLHISGFARNEPDGSVYIEAEGEEEDLNRFLTWCHNGPGAAKVKNVEVGDGEVRDFQEFEIR